MLAPNRNDISIIDAFKYLSLGIKLALSKDCRLYILIPVLINLILMSLVGYLLFTYIKDWVFQLVEA
mgnify:FL=1